MCLKFTVDRVRNTRVPSVNIDDILILAQFNTAVIPLFLSENLGYTGEQISSISEQQLLTGEPCRATAVERGYVENARAWTWAWAWFSQVLLPLTPDMIPRPDAFSPAPILVFL